jgi:hypothetical protein
MQFDVDLPESILPIPLSGSSSANDRARALDIPAILRLITLENLAEELMINRAMANRAARRI